MAVVVSASDILDDSFNATHTISALNTGGSNPYALLASFNKNPATEVTTVTADLSSMTKLTESINANVCAAQLYGLIPADSSTDFVVSTPSFKEEAMIAMALTGVDQSTPQIGTPATTGGFGSTATTSYTGTSGNMLIVIVVSQNDRTFTASGVTQVRNFSPTSGIGTVFAGYVTATGSSQTIGATLNSGDNYRVCIVEIKAAATSSTTPQTITGLARILKTVAQTITGKARVTNSALQTALGKARITASTLRTNTGLARIQKTVSQTQTGLARVTKAVTRTATGLSRITAATPRTLTGLARVTASTLRTTTGVARLQKSASQTVTGVAKIQYIVTNQTITGLARITALATKTVTGLARITQIGKISAGLINGLMTSIPAGSTPTNTHGKYIDNTAGGAATDAGGWAWYLRKSGTVSALFDSTNKHNAYNTLHINLGANGSYAEVSNGATGYFNGATYPIKPSTTYRVSYWTKAENVSGSASTGMQLDVLTNNSVGGSTGEFSQSPGVSAHGWTFRTFDFTTSATAEFYHIEARVYGHNGAGTLQGDFYYSEIQIDELNANILGKARILKTVSQTMTGLSRITRVGPSRVNLITNPSMETNITGYNEYHNPGALPATLTRDTAVAWDGAGGASLRILTAASGNSYAGTRYDASGLINGETYTFSCYVKGNVGGETFNVFFGPASTQITLTTSWQRFSVTFVASSTNPSFYLRMPDFSATFWIDGVLLERGGLMPYFDGSTAGGSWSGTAHASTSTSTGLSLFGKARITATASQTIAGLARVTNTTARTLTGLARVTKTVGQTVTGKSRITASTSRTNTGKARITVSVSRTNTGLARITKSVPRTLTGLSRITASASRALTGKASVALAVNRTLTGKSRVTKAATNTITGTANIYRPDIGADIITLQSEPQQVALKSNNDDTILRQLV